MEEIKEEKNCPSPPPLFITCTGDSDGGSGRTNINMEHVQITTESGRCTRVHQCFCTTTACISYCLFSNLNL